MLIDGQRRKNAAKHADIVGIDIDCGIDFDELIERTRRLGAFGVLHTTHSHLRAYTDVKTTAFDSWCGREGLCVDLPAMRRYLRDVKKMLPRYADSATAFEVQHLADGMFYQVAHDPIPKARLFFILKERFVFAKRGGTLAEAHTQWRRLVLAVGEALGVPVDEACTDPSRVFFMPRHPADAIDFRSTVVAGDRLDAEALLENAPADEPAQAAAKKSAARPARHVPNRAKICLVTASGLDLKAWAAKFARRFQVVEALKYHTPDILGSETSSMVGRHICCPF